MTIENWLNDRTRRRVTTETVSILVAKNKISSWKQPRVSLFKLIAVSLLSIQCLAFRSTTVSSRTPVLVPSRRDHTRLAFRAAIAQDHSPAPATENVDPIDTTTAKENTQSNNDNDASQSDTIRWDEVETIKRRAARAALLANQQRRAKSPSPEKNTSMGPRRVGSATHQGTHATLVEAVRNSARGVAAQQRKNDPPNTHTSYSVFHSAIEELLTRGWNQQCNGDFWKNHLPMGILGDRAESSILRPGSILCHHHHHANQQSMVVRVATPLDDVDIASLRLSVFADFAPEVQAQFRARSCQALHNRRLRGAVCLVVADPNVIGSAECSFHEFSGTRLGQVRPPSSLLYITEVAVHPAARRRGIGSKLLEAVDVIGNARGAETLYLHVDVCNEGALALYEKAGYQQASLDSPMFMEFTTSLNLHPGATNGRDHYLLYKNLREPTWLHENDRAKPAVTSKPLLGALGIEIPA